MPLRRRSGGIFELCKFRVPLRPRLLLCPRNRLCPLPSLLFHRVQISSFSSCILKRITTLFGALSPIFSGVGFRVYGGKKMSTPHLFKYPTYYSYGHRGSLAPAARDHLCLTSLALRQSSGTKPSSFRMPYGTVGSSSSF